MTPATFARGMAVLAQAFPARAVTDATLALYREMLADLADDEWERAVKIHLRTGRFFPAIAELLEHARPAPSVADVGPLFARVEYRALLGRGLAQVEREFGPAVARAVLAMGGIDQLRHLERPTDRAFALKGFAAALTEQHREDLLTPLVGRAPDRLAGLVRQTGMVLAFPAPRRSTPDRAS